MSGQSNFQDVVVLNNNTLSFGGDLLQIGSSAGSKSIVFAQDPAGASAIYLVASNATAAQTLVLPAVNGTIGLVTAFSAGTTLASNGQIVFSNSNGVSFGFNGNTLTASVAAGGIAIVAGTQTATSGSVVFSNSNNVSFGMSNSSVITMIVQPDMAYVMCLLGV